MVGCSRWTMARRLRRLGVLVRLSEAGRGRWYVTLAALRRVLPDLVANRPPNRDELVQIQQELTGLRKELRTLRAKVAAIAATRMEAA